MRNILRVAVLLIATAQPALTQGGGRGGGRGAPPPVRDTTGAVRKTPTGAILDFVNQDIGEVLRAIAEAGNLPVSFSRMPSNVRVSLRVQQQMTLEVASEVLKSLAEMNGFTVTVTPALITVLGPVPIPPPQQLTPQQMLAQMQQQRVLTVNQIRLKHATATTLAPVLMSLFTGTGTGGFNAGVNNGRGGITAPGVTQPFNNAAAAGGGGGGAGRGGRGAGAAGAGGGGRGAAGGANPIFNLGGAGGAGGIQQALQQAFGVGGLGVVRPFSDMRIIGEPTTNSLLVFSTAEDFAVLQQLVTGVDLRPLQVLIEVTIAQVQRTHDLDAGISGVDAKSKVTQGKSTTGATTFNTTTDTLALLPSAASARDFIYQLTGGNGATSYKVAMNALQTRGDVRVSSMPLIIAQNNVQAILNVGSSVPFVQVSQTVPNDPTGRVQTVQYQNVGTTLTITPTINQDGYVNMSVQQTNDDVTNNLLFDAPIINNRQATTQVFVRDGQTTVIGGLTDNTTNNSTSGIPFLSRIPIIGGFLFGNTTRHKDETELYLLLTPHIISSDEDLDRVRNAVKNSSELLKNTPLNGINTGGDTIHVGAPAKKPPTDTVKKKGGGTAGDSVPPSPGVPGMFSPLH